MSTPTHIESCPRCASSDNVRPKLLLIDEAWVPAPGKDPRERYFADLRVSDLKPEQVRPQPLEQFVDGFYCDGCGRGFVPEESLQADHTHTHTPPGLTTRSSEQPPAFPSSLLVKLDFAGGCR